MSLKKDFEKALEKENSTHLDRIETRSCTSDNYSGVQYNFYGGFIPVRPIIDLIADKDGLAIEQMHFTNDVEEPCFGVFVAEIPAQAHKMTLSQATSSLSQSLVRGFTNTLTQASFKSKTSNRQP